MRRSERLKSVSRLAENHKRDAARELGKGRQVLDEHRQRLEELILFRDEYMGGFQERGRSGVAGAQLIEYRAFIERLDIAIEDQRKKVSQAQETVGTQTGLWIKMYGKSKVLEQVISRYRNDERREVLALEAAGAGPSSWLGNTGGASVTGRSDTGLY